MHKLGYMFVCLLILTAWRPADAQTEEGRVKLDHADILELIMSAIEDTTYATGSVIFTTEHGVIYCDSAVFVKAKSINLRGNVVLDDDEYRLSADSVYYNIPSGDMTALGSHVELWSRKDSLFAVGTQALFNRETEYFRMENRPTLYINYPDTASMIEVVADTIDYDSDLDRANAIGDVVISTKDLVSHSGRAVMYPDENRLELYEQPIARRRKSTITGKEMTIITENDLIKQIVVTDSARAEFEEPTDSTDVFWDKSILTGEHVTLNFEEGELSRIVSWGQAYSWYYPSPQGKLETNENTVSGDTIRFTVIDDELNEVEVIGGAVGTYLSGKKTVEDSTIILKVDTINYSSKYISYAIKDSMITLTREASIISGTVQLDAQKVTLDTDRRVIEAYSGDVLPDTALSPYEYSTILEPNEIPVRLKDREEEIYGDFLEYSIDTEKGRIVQSKSSYEKGTYYGQKVFRATKDIFYINNGRYTPCDINYLHFWASHMKLINNDKLIARPVVMYIGRLPMLALPYYVFPLKKGRHSGFLPFTVGNIETGANRYIRNVGYYWAASEYWDLLGALDYYEQNSTVNFSGEANWRKRYVFDGFFRVNVAHETSYFGPPVARETKETRYTLAGSHNHIFSPSFRMSASGQYQSDPAYYQDYSANLDERLNRTLHSQASFVKRFNDKVSLSGSVTHDDNLDTKSR
ncbi:MAG: putative LPS assembly protein LptD, partial [Anaerolineales bacterium]